VIIQNSKTGIELLNTRGGWFRNQVAETIGAPETMLEQDLVDFLRRYIHALEGERAAFQSALTFILTTTWGGAVPATGLATGARDALTHIHSCLRRIYDSLGGEPLAPTTSIEGIMQALCARASMGLSFSPAALRVQLETALAKEGIPKPLNELSLPALVEELSQLLDAARRERAEVEVILGDLIYKRHSGAIEGGLRKLAARVSLEMRGLDEALNKKDEALEERDARISALASEIVEMI